MRRVDGFGFTRRSFLERAVWLAAAAGVERLAGAAAARLYGQQSVSKERLILYSARPEDRETPVHLLDSWITPNDLFYVRSHLHTPQIRLDAFRLKIDGEVGRPLELALDEIRAMPKATVVVTLECAGNGRAFFEPPVAGVQWGRGAVGTARWTGVRLRDLLARAQVRPAGRHVWLDGADRPVGTVPDFIRNLPIEKALDPDTLVAYEMNGSPLPIEHGFPLRAVVPGWEGAYAVKWLTHIQASEREQDGFFVKTAYRYPRRPPAPGAPVDAAQMAPLTGLVIKSILTSPRDGAPLSAGTVRVAGFAWAGERGVARVEISTDGGGRWSPARLGKDQARWAWRRFEYDWSVREPGSYVVLSRAADDRGLVQPVVPAWNPSGYLWNAIDQVRVHVDQPAPATTARADATPRRPELDERGAAVYRAKCLACHDGALTEQQRLSRPGWVREVDKMVRWGAEVDDDDKEPLVEFLARRFGRVR